VGVVAIGTNFNGEGGKIWICGYEGPQAVPARPSVKGRFSEGKTFRSGKGGMRSGARRELEQGLMRLCAILNFDIILGRAAFCEIWILMWGGGGLL
jgi:hypothetical protein